MTRAVAVIPARLPIEAALRLGRRRRARVLAAAVGARWSCVTLAALEHASRLGLGQVPVEAVLWGAPSVDPDAPEVTVRRALGAASPVVVVAGRVGPLGVVLADGGGARSLPLASADVLGRLPTPVIRILRSAGALGDELGWPVMAVGGFVRDLLLGANAGAAGDLDLAVEGDARELARRLGRVLGGHVREHAAFLTATLELAEGRPVDVVTARRERYATPGALPDVTPAPVADDSWRRDFSVNALAIRLNRERWGEVADPTGGLDDLRRRRIRVLHPLSFVEDPTRIFRAVRFAVRLGFRLESTTRRLLAAAAALPVYDALSGDRLRAELETVLAEPEPDAVLTRLGRLGAFRLLLGSYRFPGGIGDLVDAVAARTTGLALTAATREALYTLALTAHLAPDDLATWTTRLGLPPATRAVVERARREAPEVLGRLARAQGAGDAYAVLRRLPEPVAAWVLVLAREGRARRQLAEHLRCWRGVRPLLTGTDLTALGVEPGPSLGRLLDELTAAQVAGHVASRGEALRWARRSVAARAGAERPSQGQRNPTG